MRVLALDLGERRIGLAVSDSRGVLALPYGVIERSGDRSTDRAALAAAVGEAGAGLVVVGLPLSLSGERTAAAQAAEAEAAELAGLLGVPVETFDERLTTVEAVRRRRERSAATVAVPGARRRGSRRSAPRAGRQGIDAEAAAVLLDAWLGAHRPGRSQRGILDGDGPAPGQ